MIGKGTALPKDMYAYCCVLVVSVALFADPRLGHLPRKC